MTALTDFLLAHPQDADRLMRAACAELLNAQALAPAAEPLDLEAGLARIAPGGLEVVAQRLRDDAPAGAPTQALAALLRPAELAFHESEEIDWAVRHWEACRAAERLDEPLASDFGEYWRAVEWSALRWHLHWLGQGVGDEARLLADIAKVSARYVALAALKRAMEARHPQLFSLGFSLR
jgi:hypothetical protein